MVFDIDGTIFPSNEISTYAFSQAIFYEFGITSYNIQWDQYNKCSDIGIVREIFQTNFGKALQWEQVINFENVYHSIFSDILFKNKQLLPTLGIENIIKRLEDNNWKIAIFSGGFEKTALHKLSMINISKPHYPISTAYDGLFRKDILNSSILKAKVVNDTDTFNKTIIIGDSRQDINLSMTLELPMIGVTSSIDSDTFKHYGVEHTISNFSNETAFFTMIESM